MARENRIKHNYHDTSVQTYTCIHGYNNFMLKRKLAFQICFYVSVDIPKKLYFAISYQIIFVCNFVYTFTEAAALTNVPNLDGGDGCSEHIIHGSHFVGANELPVDGSASPPADPVDKTSTST